MIVVGDLWAFNSAFTSRSGNMVKHAYDRLMVGQNPHTEGQIRTLFPIQSISESVMVDTLMVPVDGRGLIWRFAV